jgi:hypothetical protein
MGSLAGFNQIGGGSLLLGPQTGVGYDVYRKKSIGSFPLCMACRVECSCFAVRVNFAMLFMTRLKPVPFHDSSFMVLPAGHVGYSSRLKSKATDRSFRPTHAAGGDEETSRPSLRDTTGAPRHKFAERCSAWTAEGGCPYVNPWIHRVAPCFAVHVNFAMRFMARLKPVPFHDSPCWTRRLFFPTKIQGDGQKPVLSEVEGSVRPTLLCHFNEENCFTVGALRLAQDDKTDPRCVGH